ncbi:MAG: nitrilase-related carbon-nitrogen hydrolase, partial [Candidatus Cloacimonadota bacterium]|nr:nitrilase-related carbon-nitrogen hydrolase [Candidatus Cloacimonadota bacterium]
MKIGFLQFYPQLFNEIKNLDTICKLMQDCEADLIVLPELATSGYIFTDRNELAHYTAPAYSGRIANFFRQLSQKYKCAIVTGFAENENNHFFNSQMLVLPNGKIHIYRKTHLFYKEKEIFNPGDTGLNVFEYKGVNLGLMICFDWIFPESARTLALKGADIICHSANLVLPFCQKAMVTRSIENRVFIITANRFGSEKNADEKFNFTGMSQITDVTGNVLINAGKDEECVKIVDIEPQRARNKNVTEFNNIFLDRKEDFYKV